MMKFRWIWAGLAFFCFSVLMPGTGRAQTELVVSAAASLTNAMTKAAGAFEKREPDIRIVINFASSGSLLQQMIHGAPVDLFASANAAFMDRAEKAGLIVPDSRKNFVRNRLVLAVPARSSLPMNRLEDLKDPSIRLIAIGNPDSVPAGRYARESLEDSGIWNPLKDKFVFGNSVRQVLDYLVRGEVDAGIVYATDVRMAKGGVQEVLSLSCKSPVVYPVAVLADSKAKPSARRFVDFLAGEAGWEIFKAYGFSRP